MTKVDIISGFLGAGKTTFIKKLIEDVFPGERLVLIENEFGEIGIDGGFLKDAGVEITEMNSGCICCTLVGDFSKALQKVLVDYTPDRVIIEPSGVGKLSDVVKAIEGVKDEADIEIDGRITVVDGKKAKIYLKNFGEFFNNQVEHASTIVISRTQMMTDEKVEECVHMLREKNAEATIISTPWEELGKDAVLHALQHGAEIEGILEEHAHEHDDHEHHHHHDDECGCGHDHDHHHDHEEHEHHHEHDENCTCGCHDHEEHEHDHDHDHEHHHDHEDHDHEHEHHHDHEDHDHDHEHHHEHDENCTCGCHDHEHHHHHHADEVFTSWGKETPHKFTKEKIEDVLKTLCETDDYGTILRAKGMVEDENGTWIYFDMVPGEYELRDGEPDYTGRLCVIGCNIDEHRLEELFGI